MLNIDKLRCGAQQVAKFGGPPVNTAIRFSYREAFARNIGWVTEAEQLALRGRRVAIAGMGGVGGVHLLTLARLGIGAFHIADFDSFDLANFNRQVGATIHTVGRQKVKVMEEMALGINPELKIRRFDEGVNDENIDEFLRDVDLFVDGFDFFVIGTRRRVFAHCAELGIPAVTAAPIGMGSAFLAFMPNGMTFEEYFRFEGASENEQYLRFLLGLAPRGLHRTYLVDPSRLNLATKIAPSTAAGCELSAGVTAMMAVKILLRRNDLRPAPYHYHFDAYRGKLAITRLARGNSGVGQRLKLRLARRNFSRMTVSTKRQDATGISATPVVQPAPVLEEILDAARWAPSGDNDQKWHFEIRSEHEVVVHLHQGPQSNIYEYRSGEPLVLAGGMLLESLSIAASAHGRTMSWEFQGTNLPYQILVRFTVTDGVQRDPLYPYLGLRSVNRWPYRSRPLTPRERSALEDALGDELEIDWYTSLAQRWRAAKLSALATIIRLSTPEAWPVHQRAVDWQRKLSPTGIPSGALGLLPMSLPLMRWSMQKWPRVRLLNNLGGAVISSFQMDYAPILASSAFFTLHLAGAAPHSKEERAYSLFRAGQGIQRFWLTATQLGLAMQPALAMLIFADYGERQEPFTNDQGVMQRATVLASSFRQFFGTGAEHFVFMGRIGEPRSLQFDCRSVRRPVSELIRATMPP